MNPDPCPEKRFKPGQSGNPAGRKKGTKNSITYLRAAWRLKVESKMPNGRTKKLPTAMVAAIAQVRKACQGDTRAYQEILDRLEGKVVQPMEHTGPGIVPLQPPNIIFMANTDDVEEANEQQ